MIKRCFDLRRVKLLAPDWPLSISRKVFYLVEEQDGEDLGVIVFVPTKGGLMMHVEMSEKCRGKQALEAYREAFRWIFENTDCETIIGEIPVDNRAAHVMARRSGGIFDRIEANVLRCYKLTKQMFTTTGGYA